MENLHTNQILNYFLFKSQAASLITLTGLLNVLLKGGNNQEYVIQVEWVLTHGGCGRKVNSQHKQRIYSFIINTYVHTDILHILFLCRLCLLVLGGAAWLEHPQHLLAAQISPLHHQLLSIYCEGKKTTTTMIHQSWRVGKGFTANPRQTHMVTFSRDLEVILQHCFFLKRFKYGYWEWKALLQRDLSPQFRLTSSLHLLHVAFKLNFSTGPLNRHRSIIIIQSKTSFCNSQNNNHSKHKEYNLLYSVLFALTVFFPWFEWDSQ